MIRVRKDNTVVSIFDFDGEQLKDRVGLRDYPYRYQDEEDKSDNKKVFMKSYSTEIINIIKDIYLSELKVELYYYPKNADSKIWLISYHNDNPMILNECLDDIESQFYDIKYFYFKDIKSDTYFLRLENLHYGAEPIVAKPEELKVSTYTSTLNDSCSSLYTKIDAASLSGTINTYTNNNTIEEKGEDKHMIKTNDLFTFEKIIARMDITSGKLVLDTEGHYFEDGQVMQTVPEMCMDMDAFMISTPIAQLKVADIVSYNGQFVYITEISGAAIDGITLKGEYVAFQVPAHKFFGKSMQMLPKVVSLFENFSGGADFNPMMLMFLKDDNKESDIFKMMMLGQMFQNMNKDKEKE